LVFKYRKYTCHPESSEAYTKRTDHSSIKPGCMYASIFTKQAKIHRITETLYRGDIGELQTINTFLH